MSISFDEIFVLFGATFCIFRIEEDGNSAAFGRIEIVQNGVSLAVPRQDWVFLGQGEGTFSPKGTLLQKGQMGGGARQIVDAHTYLAFFSDRDATSQFNAKVPFQVRIDGERGVIAQEVLDATPVSPQWLAASELKSTISDVFEESGQSEIAAIIQSSISIGSPDAFGLFSIERAIAGGSGVVLEGWIAHLANREVHVLTGDLSALVTKSALSLRSRPDVHQHLHDTNALTAGYAEHGFVAVLPAVADEGDVELFLLECDPSDDQVTFCGPVRTRVRRDEKEALELVRQSFGEIQWLPRRLANQIYRPLLAVPKHEVRARTFRFGPPAEGDGEPVCSIIIPYYGDAFFLNCVYHLQRVLGSGFELVLVVDDARIWPEIYSSLTNRSRSITVPTILLQNEGNYGFGRANNLGFLAASGDVLFLMNSDIMVMDANPLREAAAAIRARQAAGEPDLVVGFSLLYEDDTIQHIGIEFPRSSTVDNMHIADHPMKGLPFALYRGDTIRNVPAVTAALMAVSSNLYQRLGGFDAVYERGDFEDADLCLRAEQLGAEVQVYVRPGLYHLERQSIPSMGDSDLRQMVTYMNCAEFNQRWQARLSQQATAAPPRSARRIQVRKRASAR